MSNTLSRTEIIADIAATTGIRKTLADQVISAFLAATAAATKAGLEVRLTGFGTFHRRHRPEHTGRNPQTGATLLVPASSTLAFRPSKAGGRK